MDTASSTSNATAGSARKSAENGAPAAGETKAREPFNARRTLFPLAALFGPFLMYRSYPGGDVGRHIAPLSQLETKLTDLLRQIRRRIKSCLIHGTVVFIRIVISLCVPRLDLARDRERQLGGLPPPR